jgi:hypothetical protein
MTDTEANAVLTNRLKECRSILRAHGLGHLYPDANPRIEQDMKGFSGVKNYYSEVTQAREKETKLYAQIYDLKEILNRWPHRLATKYLALTNKLRTLFKGKQP